MKKRKCFCLQFDAFRCSETEDAATLKKFCWMESDSDRAAPL